MTSHFVVFNLTHQLSPRPTFPIFHNFLNTKGFDVVDSWIRLRQLNQGTSLLTLERWPKIYFDWFSLMKVIRKQGIEQIVSIDSDLGVNLTNKTQMSAHSNRLLKICLGFNRDYSLTAQRLFASDQDFCLLIHFPFEQVVLLEDQRDLEKNLKVHSSSTELQLNRFY